MPDRADDSGPVPTRRPATLHDDGSEPETPDPPDPDPPRPTRCVRAAGVVLTSEYVRGVEKITVAGELTVATAPLLDAEMVEACRAPDRLGLNLVLDLTDVTFLDMMGIAALRRVHYRALLLGGLRLGLPVAYGPGRMLDLAVDCGWLAPPFRPTVPSL